MKYVKALIKTVNLMDDFDRKMFIGISFMILGLVFIIPSLFILDMAILFIVNFFIGIYFILSGFWLEEKEDFIKFVNKIKKNVE